MYRASGASALVPPGVVTRTLAVPSTPGGTTAVISVSETTLYEVAGIGPKATPVAPLKPSPVKVTLVPPARGPDEGLTPDSTGAATSPTVIVTVAGAESTIPSLA
jgi:hypothetical protein